MRGAVAVVQLAGQAGGAAAEAGWPVRGWMGEEPPGRIRGGREQVGVDGPTRAGAAAAGAPSPGTRRRIRREGEGVALGSAAWVGVATGARAGVVAAAEARRGPVGRGASGLPLRRRSAARPEWRLGRGQPSAGTGAAAARHGATGGGAPEFGNGGARHGRPDRSQARAEGRLAWIEA